MFGIPLTTLLTLAVTYGPDAIKFIQAADPLLHQLVVAAMPLVEKVKQQFNISVEDAAPKGIALLSLGGHAWTDDELRAWWDRNGISST